MWMAIIKRRKTNEFYFPDEKWTHKRNFHLAQTGSYDTRAITWSSSGDKLFNFNAISCFYALNLMRVNSRLIVCRPLIRLCTYHSSYVWWLFFISVIRLDRGIKNVILYRRLESFQHRVQCTAFQTYIWCFSFTYLRRKIVICSELKSKIFLLLTWTLP